MISRQRLLSRTWQPRPSTCQSNNSKLKLKLKLNRRPYHPSSSSSPPPPPPLRQPVPASTALTNPRSPSPYYIPAPEPDSGPLLRRHPNRALPAIDRPSRTWLKTLPVFLALVTASTLAIFNYQKSSSSTVNSVLYALRTSDAAADVLGDRVYFASKVPWIRGELNQLHGRIDISFWVKGSKGTGEVRFASRRGRRDQSFETSEWSLRTEDGKVIQLLDSVGGGKDPFQTLVNP